MDKKSGQNPDKRDYEIHSQFGLTRTDWQILNLLKERNEISQDELLNIMKPFADKPLVSEILTKLKNQKVIEELNSKLTLTQKGLETYRECFERQKIFRNKSMEGISEQEYQTTYLTLKKLVDNLEKE